MIIHLNGQLVPVEQAAISPFDRGFVFGDGIYEGLRSFRGRIVALDRHLRRMRAGLAESRIDFDPAPLGALSEQLMAANALPDAFVYWQITRGAPLPGQPVRTRVPGAGMRPTVFGYCSSQPPLEAFTEPPTCTAAVRPDTRWQRGHMKSIALMGNVIAAMEAREAGAQDAIFVRGGLVAEGTATNVILALPEPGGATRVVTPSLSSVSILGGITRELLLENAPQIEERPVRVEELFAASEIMLVGSTSMVTSVLMVDGRPVGTGRIGSIARTLLRTLVRAIELDLGLAPAATVAIVPGVGAKLGPCGTSQAVA